MSEDPITRERLRAHQVDGDGNVRCSLEYTAQVLTTPTGPVREIRCPHWTDPLRYEPAGPVPGEACWPVSGGS